MERGESKESETVVGWGVFQSIQAESDLKISQGWAPQL